MTSKRKKIGLAVVFSLGVITIAVSVGRFITMVYVDNAISICLSPQSYLNLISNMVLDIWATAEICISVIVVALTAVRPLLRKLTNLKSTLLTSEDQSGIPAVPSNRSRQPRTFAGVSGIYWHATGKSQQRYGEAMDPEISAGSETELNNINGNTLTGHAMVSRESTINSIPTQPDYTIKD